MAANEYYNKPLPKPAPSQFDPYTPQTSHSSPAPPYSSTQALPLHQPTVSPFESVFDDHVYPLDSRQGSQSSMQKPARYGQDTAYYGQGRVSPEEQRYGNDDIPLQDRPPPIKDSDIEMSDHVHDAPGRQKKKKKGNVRFGQLGMFGADKKRIPFVVYIFSAVQIIVFIVEIVKNGRFRNLRPKDHVRKRTDPRSATYRKPHHDQAAG